MTSWDATGAVYALRVRFTWQRSKIQKSQVAAFGRPAPPALSNRARNLTNYRPVPGGFACGLRELNPVPSVHHAFERRSVWKIMSV